jgi:hypothetical protein
VSKRSLTEPARETVITLKDEDDHAAITTHQRAILT